MKPTKTVLITGATRGIGLALARLYAARGWKVIGAARDPSNAQQLSELPLHALVALDVADEAAIRSAAEQLAGETIDLLINNAGILVRTDMAATTKSDFMRTLEVNAVGPLLVTRAFLPQLKRAVAARGAAAVVQISSLSGSIEQTAACGSYSYHASKAALNMLNASLAVDLAPDGIAAFTLHPGYVATDMNGFRGVISTETSADGLASVIDRLTLADTGVFMDHNGDVLPW
ncbi:hypothetical protein PybrP1_000515 [[Pythium] brassicae (nom. inval.)]|nr:hypothetical protein PybrP1_000515 [[Pythium] brassicae (nom. inval.)]